MITVQWWVPLAIFFGGMGVALFCATIWRAHIDAQIELRTPVPAPEPEPVAQSWQPPVPPWVAPLSLPPAPEVDTSWRGFGTRLDGTDFTGEDTVSFVMPSPAAVDEEPKPSPRSRFVERQPARDVVVSTTVADVVRSDRVEVHP